MKNLMMIGRERSALEILLNEGKTKHKRQRTSLSKTPIYKRDQLTLSKEAVQLQKAYQTTSTSKTTTSKNISFDQKVDIQSYFDRAMEHNQAAIANAGDEITGSPQNHAKYFDYYDVYRQILTDKYTALVETAKQQSDPEMYIQQKYFDPACSWYVSDLTEMERGVGYRNEISVLKKGTTDGLDFRDSFFRINNITLPYEEDMCSTMSFNRQMINAQISNIFKNNGIELGEEEEYSLTVDPYSYYITVACADESKKQKMELALNVGDNGVYLWRHINNSATRDHVKSEQVNTLSYKKHQTYEQVKHFTGYKLDELREADGTYYTEDGTDIKDIIKKMVMKDADVSFEYKAGIIEMICEMVTELSRYGWNHIPDMFLTIGGDQSGLHDVKQNNTFDFGSDFVKRYLQNAQYKVLSDF